MWDQVQLLENQVKRMEIQHTNQLNQCRVDAQKQVQSQVSDSQRLLEQERQVLEQERKEVDQVRSRLETEISRL